MPCVATWIDPEVIILSEVRRKKTITIQYEWYCNLKYDTNELIYETETESQT